MNYRSGRSTSQLAGLLGPAALSALWSAAFGGPASAAQPAGASRPASRKRKAQNIEFWALSI